MNNESLAGTVRVVIETSESIIGLNADHGADVLDRLAVAFDKQIEGEGDYQVTHVFATNTEDAVIAMATADAEQYAGALCSDHGALEMVDVTREPTQQFVKGEAYTSWQQIAKWPDADRGFDAEDEEFAHAYRKAFECALVAEINRIADAEEVTTRVVEAG